MRGRFDFVKDVAAWLSLIVIGDMLGVEPADSPKLLEWSETMLMATGTTSAEVMLRAADGFGAYQEDQKRLTDDRRRNPGDDLISVVVHSRAASRRRSGRRTS